MKQNKLTYRFLAFFMATLMLMTSVSFVLDMHFCGHHLVSINFLGKAKNCNELAQIATKNNCSKHDKTVERPQSCSSDMKDCCSNKTVHFDADQDKQIQMFSFVLTNPFQQFITAYVAVFHTSSISLQSDSFSFADYKTPYIPRDYSVLFQAFLI